MTIRRLPAPTSSATLHALAKDRHRTAIERKLAGDEDGYLDGLADVRAFDEQASEAREREDRLAMHIEERRRMHRALVYLLDLADRHAPEAS